jgi:plasmid stabilization system protein ParE
VIRLSLDAQAQLDALLAHYDEIERPEAVRSLIAALDLAVEQIEGNTAARLPAPRPYPSLARPGRVWMKSGRYWIAYSTTTPPMILAVFYDQANIPGRL